MMAATAFRDYVEQVRAACDIADIIGESVQLRKAGRSIVGLCPFHQEKTPSFHVDSAKGVYYCFGCQAGGDLFKFVIELHGVDFAEAAQMLGDRYGIPRPARRAPEAREEDRRRRRVLEALDAAQQFFAANLLDAGAGSSRRYLEGRGLDKEAAARFGLGFARDSWDDLLRHLSGRGFEPRILHDAGLVVTRKEGGGAYDRFRSRITFPIRDTAGRIVSFGGRALGQAEPKYLNGPETPVYDKSRTLFRYSEVAQEIRKSGRAVVVEGYFDAVGLAARGVHAVVAVCGTALGPAHAKLLQRMTNEVVLFLDGDSAGHKAARRAMQPLLETGLGVRVATPPAGKDPDDLAREGGQQAVESCIEKALELPEFLVAAARREFDTESLQGRVSALDMILEHLVMLPSTLARAEAGDRVAAGLKIEDGVVREELKRAIRKRSGTMRISPVAAARAESGISESEAVLLRYLGGKVAADNPQQAVELIDLLPQAGLGHLSRKVVDRWIEARKNDQPWDLRQMAEGLEELESKQILALAFASTEEPGIEQAKGSLVTIRETALRRRLTAVQKEIDGNRDSSDLDRLVQQKVNLAREIQELGTAIWPN